ncbi:unnamed protein product, partial [Ectocarpus sp. 12 AP-2014]
MSARQLNRLAKAKGLDPLLGGGLNEESEESDGCADSEDEGELSRGGVVSASAFGEYSSESSSSEEEDGSDSDNSSDSGGEAGDSTPIPSKLPAPEEGGRKQTAPDIEDDDDEYLDNIISELARKAAAAEAGEGGPTDNRKLGTSSPLALLLRC